jgi:DNA-binding beta-propeller fold protein YncE
MVGETDMKEKKIQRENITLTEKRHENLLSVPQYSMAVFFFAILILIVSAPYAAADIGGAYYLYNLSDFSGSVPYSWAGLSVDRAQNEIYVVYQNDIEVFNEKGMKIYSFGDDENISGVIYDVAVAGDGSIFLLLHADDNYSVMRCNYRGESVSEIKFRNFPPAYSRFVPARIIYSAGDLYLADLMTAKKVVITDINGNFKAGYDINSLFGLDEFENKPGQEKEIAGFSVDRSGNMLFTVPTISRAFVLSADGKVRSFGESGNIPGKFSVVAGIAADDSGNIYIADTLKSVVMIFDKNFNFIMEFGYRGEMPENLIAPRNMVVSNGNIYVSQARKRGVSVYKIVNN